MHEYLLLMYVISDEKDCGVAMVLYQTDPAQRGNKQGFERYREILDSLCVLPEVLKSDEQLPKEERIKEVE